MRDPIVAQATLPRFLALGDQSRFHRHRQCRGSGRRLFHRSRRAWPARACRRPRPHARSASPHRRKSRSDPGHRRRPRPRRSTCARRRGGKRHAELRRADAAGRPEVYRRIVRRIAAAGEPHRLEGPAGRFPAGTGSVGVSVSPLGAHRRAGAAEGARPLSLWLHRADRVAAPCRCSTSTSSPRGERLALDDIDERVETAIERVLARQDRNGSFGLWSAESADDLWLDAFTSRTS